MLKLYFNLLLWPIRCHPARQWLSCNVQPQPLALPAPSRALYATSRVQSGIPSAGQRQHLAARAMRSRIASGTETLSFVLHELALRTLVSGQIPASTGMR